MDIRWCEDGFYLQAGLRLEEQCLLYFGLNAGHRASECRKYFWEKHLKATMLLGRLVDSYQLNLSDLHDKCSVMIKNDET